MRAVVRWAVLRPTAGAALLVASALLAPGRASAQLQFQAGTITSWTFDQCFDDFTKAPYRLGPVFCVSGTLDVGRVANGGFPGSIGASVRALTGRVEGNAGGNLFYFNPGNQLLRLTGAGEVAFFNGPGGVYVLPGTAGVAPAQATPIEYLTEWQWVPPQPIPEVGATQFQSMVTITQFTPTAVVTPEPGAVALLGTGLVGLAALVRRRRA